MPTLGGHQGEVTVCTVCEDTNDPLSLFCRRCTAPLRVVPLSDLTGDDLQTCLTALFEVLGEPPVEVPAAETEQVVLYDDELFRAYLAAYWARPETALLQYSEAQTILQTVDLDQRPWLDLGCGDGIHAALYGGWRFNPTFDAFQGMNPLARDVYDHWDPSTFSVDIDRRGADLDYGVDIKETSVERSRALGVFGEVLKADATQIPLPGGSIRTIFSNMIRDLGDSLSDALAECARLLTADGTLLLTALTPLYASSLYFVPSAQQAAQNGDTDRAESLLRLDRGRSTFSRQQLSANDWQTLLHPHGLAIEKVAIVAGPRAIRFWDVGFRPFTSMLLDQRATWLRAGQMQSVKPGLVEVLAAILSPLVHGVRVGPPCMQLLKVRKM